MRPAARALGPPCLLGLVLVPALAAPAPAAAAAVTTLPARADGWVDAGAPRRSHGRSQRLRVAASPARAAYLRFVVRRLAPPPRRVTLRVRALSAGRAGVSLRMAGTRRFSERRLSWRAAPRLGRLLGTHGRFAPGWLRFDLTDVIRHPGSYNFAIVTSGRRPLTFSARESGKRAAPSLVIRTSGSATPAGRALTQPPGFRPLSDARAAALVRPAREIRPENAGPNRATPTSSQREAFLSASREPYTSLVTGGFTGSTDAIIQWAARKWGLDEDLMRAVAVQESDWRQSTVGDGGVSFGLFQVKTQLAGSDGWPGTDPLAREDTAFNADYYGRAIRSCFDGRETWLAGSYRAGDLWGCVGWWFSGGWHDAGAQRYVREVQTWLARRIWERPGY
jgi:hypothetical protein